MTAVLKQVAQQERQANLRAGLIAAVIVNSHRKKGARLLQPEDFVKGPRRHMSIEEATRHMDSWAHGINKAVEQHDPTLQPRRDKASA